MYLEFYKLDQHPFQIVPDFHFLYLSRQHARAMAYMKYTVVNHEGFAVISGEIGSGKTTLVQKFLAEMDRGVTVVRVTQSLLNAIEFLQTIARGLGSKSPANDKVALHNEIRRELEQQRTRKNNVLLLIDDAQNLDDSVLEEIRLLSDSETENGGSLSIILVGQPELEHRLKQPVLRQLDQRVRLRFKLGPLSEEETDLYIQYRMKLAGWEGPPLFEPDACYAIYRYTKGVPRLINILCDSILLNAFVEGEHQLSVKLVDAAAKELDWDIAPPLGSRRKTRTGTAQSYAQIDSAGSTAPIPSLVVGTSDGFIERFNITAPLVRLGRTSENDLQLSHPKVSEQHAAVIKAGEAYYLVDLDSEAGTQVGNRLIVRHELHDGTIFRIAPYEFRFELPQATNVQEIEQGKKDSDVPERDATEKTASEKPRPSVVASN